MAVGLLVPLAHITPATAQTRVEAKDSVTATPEKSDPADLLPGIIEERHAIAAEMAQLVRSGANPEQIEIWNRNNAARLAAIQQKLSAMAARQDSKPQPYIREVQIPPGASENLENFLIERAKLNNEQILVHNQTLQASPEKRSEAIEAWQKQNAAVMEAQAARASQISGESQPPDLPVPSPADIPPNATPELKDFITRRNALIKAEAGVIAHLKTATPEQRQQALEAWRASNPLPARAMQDAAVRLSNESKTSN
jgi:hypothetical protein